MFIEFIIAPKWSDPSIFQTAQFAQKQKGSFEAAKELRMVRPGWVRCVRESRMKGNICLFFLAFSGAEAFWMAVGCWPWLWGGGRSEWVRTSHREELRNENNRRKRVFVDRQKTPSSSIRRIAIPLFAKTCFLRAWSNRREAELLNLKWQWSRWHSIYSRIQKGSH